MLKYDRDEVLRERGQWTWSNEKPLRIFGACTYKNPGRPGNTYLQRFIPSYIYIDPFLDTVLKSTTELSSDGQLQDYLLQRGKYVDLFPPERPQERLRLAFCERRYFQPPDFCMSNGAFEAIENDFGLSQATMSVFAHQGGAHTYSFEYDGDQFSSVGMFDHCCPHAHAYDSKSWW